MFVYSTQFRQNIAISFQKGKTKKHVCSQNGELGASKNPRRQNNECDIMVVLHLANSPTAPQLTESVKYMRQFSAN